MKIFGFSKISAVVYIVLAFAAVTMTTIYVTNYFNEKITVLPSQTTVAVNSVNSQQNEQVKEDFMYIIKEVDGKVGVVDYTNKLLYNLDVTLDGLPTYDQEILKEGIKVKDDAKLKSLIEDLTS